MLVQNRDFAAWLCWYCIVIDHASGCPLSTSEVRRELCGNSAFSQRDRTSFQRAIWDIGPGCRPFLSPWGPSEKRSHIQHRIDRHLSSVHTGCCTRGVCLCRRRTDRYTGPTWYSAVNIGSAYVSSGEFTFRLRYSQTPILLLRSLQIADAYTVNKKLSYRRWTARSVESVEILPIVTQQCRNYLYDKSWTNRSYEVGGLQWNYMCNKHVHSTVTRSSRFHCPIGVTNKPTTDELWNVDITCIPTTCCVEIF